MEEVYNQLTEEQELEQGRRKDQRAFNVAMTAAVLASGFIALVLYVLLTAFI